MSTPSQGPSMIGMTTSTGAPGAPVQTADVVETIAAPSGGVSFDDIEAIYDASEANAKSAKKEASKKESKKEDAKKASPKKADPYKSEKNNSTEKVDPNALDQEDSAEGKKSNEQEEDSKENDDHEEQEKVKDEKNNKVEKPKIYKLKVGDQEIEVPGNVELEVTVGGKPEKVTYQELLNQYSGKTDWTRKYTQLDLDRKTFHTEKNGLQSSINKLHDLAVKQGKPDEAIAFLAQAMGGDAQSVMKQFRDTFWNQFDSLKDLTPEARQAFEAEQELKYYRDRDSERARADREAKMLTSVRERVKAIQEAHNLTDAGFYQHYEALAKQVDSNTITPEAVEKHIVSQKTTHELGQMMDELAPGVENKAQAISDLTEIMKSNGFSPQDMRDVIKEVYAPKVLEKPKSKLAAKLKRKELPRQGVPANQTDAYFFDDLG